MRRWSNTQLRVVEDAVSRTSHSLAHGIEAVLRLPGQPESRWHRAGVSARGERIFNVVAGLLLALFIAGWTWTVVDARRSTAEGLPEVAPLTGSLTAALTDFNALSTPFLTEAALRAFTPLRGRSGRLRASIQPPGAAVATDTVPLGAHIEIASGDAADSLAPLVAPTRAGVWQMVIKVGTVIKPVTDFSVITLRPFTDKRRGRIGPYQLGSWPYEGGRTRSTKYTLPSGFIEVTEEIGRA